MANQEWSIVPNMRLHRDDVKEFTKKRLSDKQMQEIADTLGKYLMNEWNECLRLAV